MPRRRRYNPLAPLNPRQQQALAGRYVRSQTTPLLNQINREFTGRARSGEQAIAGYTNELANRLAGMQGNVHNIYAGAQAQQQGIDSALAAKIASAGSGVGDEVGAKLAAAGLGSVPNTLANQGAGLAAASSGKGSAALSALVASGAAAESYAGAQPGIARLGGLQRARQYAAQLEAERAQQVGALRSKIPGLIQQILGDIRNQEFQKAAARLSYSGDVYNANLDYQASSASTAERRESNRRKARIARDTLEERARYHGRSLDQQRDIENRKERERRRHNRASEKQQRQNERGRNRRSKNKKKSGGNPWDN